MNKEMRIVLAIFGIGSLSVLFSIQAIELFDVNDYDAAVALLGSMFLCSFGISMIFPWRNNRSTSKGVFVRLLFILVSNSIIFGITFRSNESVYSIIEKGSVNRAKRKLNQIKQESNGSRKYQETLERCVIIAVVNHEFEIIKLLLEYNVDLNNFEYSNLPLEEAIRIGSKETYEQLVLLGANPNENGGEQLYQASSGKNTSSTDMLKYVLSKGIDPNAARKGIPTLHYLVSTIYDTDTDEQEWKLIKCLINSGADINFISPLGLTPFLYARNNRVKDRLVKMGAIPIEVGKFGRTKLMQALKADNNLREINQIIAENSMLLEIGDETGNRPLNELCIYGFPPNIDYLELLLKSGANPNSTSTNSGLTPICGLLRNQYSSPEALELLIQYGAEINLTTSGDTPLEYVADQGNIEYVKILLKNGAVVTPKVRQNVKNRQYNDEILKYIQDHIKLITQNNL
ncbi:ankyrin repeat domain-containing protein [Marinilabiliaceae bacterium JC017]|nr:ankyrin repeat domain-containing protein [Marinilabiliaceae bacterium JC017]